MTHDTPHTRYHARCGCDPLDTLDLIESGRAIAVRTSKAGQNYRDILCGTVVDVPEESIASIIEQQNKPYDTGTPITPIIQIDADRYWRIDKTGLTDRSSDLEDRPPIKRHPNDELHDPPTCSVAVDTDSRPKLVIPTPTGTGAHVREYHPTKHGRLISLVTGPWVTPLDVLPDWYDQLP